MNPHCECPVAGFCERHQKLKGPEQHKRCQGTAETHDCGLRYWNAWEQGRAGATAPPEPKLNPEGFCSHRPKQIKVADKSSVGNALAEIIKRETGKDIPCPACAEDIRKLNAMTVDECRKVKPEYVNNIYDRSYGHATLLQKAAIVVDSLLNTGVTKKVISSWYDEALETGVSPKKPQVEATKERLRKVAARAAGVRENSRSNVKANAKPTAEQKMLYAKMRRKPQPVQRPFEGPIAWNLVYHMWPVRDAWQWHAKKLNELLPSINGKIIIGLATDDTTATLQDVRDVITDGRIIWIENDNLPECGNLSVRGKPFGEVATLQAALPLLRDTGDSITAYAHAKGMRPHTKDSEAVRIWTEIMYETVTFAQDETVKAMQDGYNFFGAFRTFGFRPLRPKHQWHYSGTFFNFRTQAAYVDNAPVPIQHVYGGVEAWPGDVCPDNEAFCVFEDNAPWLRQYALNLMYPHVVDRQMQWEADRIGSPRCEQHKRELDWFLSLIRQDDRLLVIGSKHGGLEAAILRSIPSISIVSVDIAPQPDNQNTIVGDSSSPEIQKKLQGFGPFDVVFIDGDHSLQGVTSDWQFAQTLHPRLIAFHDVAKAIKHRREGCEVDLLWNKLKQQFTTSERIVGCGWGGIGVVHLER